MNEETTRSGFTARLLRPAASVQGDAWAFVVLPPSVSEKLPRRGRTSVEGTINGHPFQSTLEPDGQLSHWLKVGPALLAACGAAAGDMVALEIAAVASEPEPELPPDFRQALAGSPQARTVWEAATTLARLDWIHWIESAKQARTRESRIAAACAMLASGKKRVCCFDPSGFYSKSLRAPQAAP